MGKITVYGIPEKMFWKSYIRKQKTGNNKQKSENKNRIKKTEIINHKSKHLKDPKTISTKFHHCGHSW